MTAYLDTNIIVGLEDGEFSLDEIINLVPSKKPVRFFYSSAHIFELEGFQGNSKISKEELLAQRFASIKKIFKNNYLFLPKTNAITHIIEDPKIVYDTISLHPTGIDAMRGFMDVVSSEKKQEYREKVGIEIQKLNNYNSTEIIGHLSTRMSGIEHGLSFLETIEEGIRLHPDGKSMGLHNRFAGIFELLDMLGYWKDKETLNSNYARLWDSLHSFFATYCDYFVSNDKKTRQKAEVLFNLYNKNTKIVFLPASR